MINFVQNYLSYSSTSYTMGQVMDKLKKGEPTGDQADKLAGDMKPLIDRVYDKYFKEKNNVGCDDLYHAIFEIIQELRTKRGAMQYNLPSKDKLKEAFDKCHHGSSLTKEECREIINRVVTVGDFTVGKGSTDILMYMFGIPLCVLMAKRIIPGIRSISGDVVIPLATSGSVIFLVKTHKL